mmetsp:Transcript_23841/g.51864  ORF Transcript_23841/g.51864 Transcript_23841/m.51864 type:complete len:266 (-) Transcript_23841:1951-2748(-)
MHLGLQPLVHGHVGIIGTIGIKAQALSDQRLLNLLGSAVGGQNDQSVLEGNDAALGVCKMSILQDLQHEVEDVRVCLFHFIEEDQAVGFPSNWVRQLTLLIVADVARRAANQLGHRVLFHEFTHIQSDHGIFHAKIGFSQGFAEFRLANTCGTAEDEGRNGPLGILQPRTCTSHRLRDGHHSLLLPDDPVVQGILQMNQTHGLIGRDLFDWHLGPGRNHSGHVVLRHRGLGQCLLLVFLAERWQFHHLGHGFSSILCILLRDGLR